MGRVSMCCVVVVGCVADGVDLRIGCPCLFFRILCVLVLGVVNACCGKRPEEVFVQAHTTSFA